MATRARNNKRKKPEPSEDLSDHEEGHVEKKAKKARIEVKKEEEIPSYAGAATDTGDRYGDLNQDRYLVTEIKIKNNSPVLVMGIFDGHGKHGEIAAEIAKISCAEILKEKLASLPSKPTKRTYTNLMNDLFDEMHKRIIDEYQNLKKLEWDGNVYELRITPDGVNFYYCKESDTVFLQDFGTTAVVSLVFPETKTLVVADVGDSKAVLVRHLNKPPRSTRLQAKVLQSQTTVDHVTHEKGTGQDSKKNNGNHKSGEESEDESKQKGIKKETEVKGKLSGSDDAINSSTETVSVMPWEALVLTESHNVSEDHNEDIERIKKQHGSKVGFTRGYIHPTDGKYSFHALAMTRSLGHKFLTRIGVSFKPHIETVQLDSSEDVYLVGGSDGLWDCMEDDEAVEIINNNESNLRTAALELVKGALNAWRMHFPNATEASEKADNTTAVAINLQKFLSANQE
jgi:serine/threonine protein phosphatase PrpC